MRVLECECPSGDRRTLCVEDGKIVCRGCGRELVEIPPALGSKIAAALAEGQRLAIEREGRGDVPLRIALALERIADALEETNLPTGARG